LESELNALKLAHNKALQKLKDENANLKFTVANLEKDVNNLKNQHKAALKDLNDKIKQ